jgi:hypothetical protein
MPFHLRLVDPTCGEQFRTDVSSAGYLSEIFTMFQTFYGSEKHCLSTKRRIYKINFCVALCTIDCTWRL